MPIAGYPIHTPRLELRPLTGDDLSDVYAFYSRPDVTRYLYWDTRTLEETKDVLEKKKTQTVLTEEGSALVLAVVLKETGTVIGEVSLVWRSREHQQGEVGFVFHPDAQGHGYATEATRIILSTGFEQQKLHRIYGRCDPRNIRSFRLMERLGMRREAHFIHNERFKGEWGDELVYAMLHDEWAVRRSKHQFRPAVR